LCARLATAQEGLVQHRQLIEAGVSRGAIKRLVRSGTLHPRHRGVYIVGHLALAPRANEAAALLACGEGSVISHRSAAHLWGLLERAPDVVDVTVVGHHCRPKAGVCVHKRAKLDARYVRQRDTLPVTSPARTVIDLAADSSERELEAVIAQARARGQLRDGELELELDRAGPQAGIRRLRALLNADGAGGLTRSEAERILRRLLREAELQQPKSNVNIVGWEVDFIWPEQRLVVEVDGYPFHSSRAAFERDRRKDMALRDSGYDVIRISARQLKERPYAVIAHIARALERGRRSSG
jgi:very-short-patch-repair endonuclease